MILLCEIHRSGDVLYISNQAGSYGTPLVDYRGDIVDDIEITQELPDAFYGIAQNGSITLRLGNEDNGVDPTWDEIAAEEELRGCYVVLSRDDGEHLFTGVITDYTRGLETTITVTPKDESLDALLPSGVVTNDIFYPTALDTGAAIQINIGWVKDVPCPNIQYYKSATSTTTGTEAFKLVDAGAAFTDDDIGRYVHRVDEFGIVTIALVTAKDSPTKLSLDTDIFVEKGESYSIQCYDYLVGYGTIDSLWIDHANGRGIKRDGVLVPEAEYTFDDGAGAPTDHGYAGYATIRFAKEQVGFNNERYYITADAKGLDSGNRNFADAIEAILSNATWGLNQSIDAATFADAVTALPVGSYMCDISIYEQRKVRDILNDILFPCHSWIQKGDDNEWEMYVDGTAASSANFGENDGYYDNCEVLSCGVTPAENAVKTAYANYDTKSLDTYRVNPLIASLGRPSGARQKSIVCNTDFGIDAVYELVCVSENVTADKFLSYIYGRAHYADKKITILAGEEAESLTVGQVITLTIPARDIDAKTYRIIRTVRGLGKYTLECEAYDSAIFDDQVIADPTASEVGYSAHSLNTMDSGTVGGMMVTGSYIITSDGMVGMSSAVTGGTDWRIWAGSSTPGSAPFRVDENGAMWATNAIIEGAITAGTIDIGGADATSFHVDADGNIWAGAAVFNIATNPFAVSSAGVIRAVSGTIGGFTLGATTLTATNLLLDAGNQEIKLGTGNDIVSLDAADGTYRLAIGHATYGSAPFRVTKGGAVTATSATITGTITATAGTIGGFTVDATEGLYAGAAATRVQMKAGVGIWTGATAIGDAPFSVTNAGVLVATNATIAGAISAATIDIGGDDATSFHVDIDGGIWSGASIANKATAPFRVSNAGVLVATSATITGALSGGTIDIGGADATSFHVDVDGNIWSGAAAFADGTFRVSSAGDLVANSGSFRGILKTAVFEKDVINAVGGSVAISKGSDVLTVTMTALDACDLTVEGNESFAVGDLLRIKDDLDDEWFEVTGCPTFRSNASYLNEGCVAIEAWTNNDQAPAATTQCNFGGKECFCFDTNASAAGNDYCNIYIDPGSIEDLGNRVTVSLRLYCDGVGTLADTDYFRLAVQRSDTRLLVAFASDGLYINDGADWNEIGTNLVVNDAFQEWTFDIDFSPGAANAVCDVYLDDDLQMRNVPCGDTGAHADGMIKLHLYGSTTDDRTAHLDWLFVGDDITSTHTYTVTRDQGTHYAADANPEWEKGATVVNYGQSGDGFIYMTASNTNAPYVSIATHAGAPWTTISEKVRLGNLNGYAGYAADLYGLALYEDANNYLLFDPTNGIRLAINTADAITIKSGGSITLEAGGDINFGLSDANPSLLNWGDTYYLGSATTAARGICFWPDTNFNGYWHVGYDPITNAYAPFEYIRLYASHTYMQGRFDADDFAYVSVMGGDGTSYAQMAATAGGTTKLLKVDANDGYIKSQGDLCSSVSGSYLLGNSTLYWGALYLTGANTRIIVENHKESDIASNTAAFDDAYADDWHNVADFFYLDDFDDLSAICAIRPSGKVDFRTNLPLIDDNTLPEIILSKNKKGKGILRDLDGKPYISQKAADSLSWGAIRQLKQENDFLRSEIARLEGLISNLN